MRAGLSRAAAGLATAFAVAFAGAVAAAIGLPSVVAAHGFNQPAPTFPATLFDWSLEPLPIAGSVIAVALYLWAERRVIRLHPATRPPRLRRWLFLGGIAAILLALTSPIDAYEGALFSVHMVQHMILELVAAPLIVLSAPITLALRAASPGARRLLLAVLHSVTLRLLTFPLVTWLLFAAVNWGWHFSSWYNVALENAFVHDLEHMCFLAAALLFWWPAVGPDPQPWRMPHPVKLLYLFLAMPQNSFLGVALLSSDHVLYLHYLTNHLSWAPAALDDQHLGGTLMWVFGDLAFLSAMIGVVADWMRYEDRKTARLDARLDAQLNGRRE